MAVSGTSTYDFTPDVHLSVKGIWNRRKSSNQAAPLPFGIGPDAGNHAGPRCDLHRRDQPIYNPFGVTLQATIRRPLRPMTAISI